MGYSIYIASKLSSRYRLRPIKAKLKSLGYNVLSKWMDPDVNMDPSIDLDSLGNNLEESKAEAERDKEELDRTDIFIIDTFDRSESGGRDVELGMILEKARWFKSLEGIFRVGPIRNVFHTRVPAHNSWDEMIDYLLKEFPND